MSKGLIFRDNFKIINDHITFYGQVIRRGIEFKLVPLKVHKENYKLTNTSTRDPYVNYIKQLLVVNKFNTDGLKIYHLDNDSWEVEISD